MCKFLLHCHSTLKVMLMMKIERIRGSDATDRTYTYKIERKIRMF